MLSRKLSMLISTGLFTLAVSACGGGGITYVAAIPQPASPAPTPTPSPTPAVPSAAVDIFPSPVTQEFATIGVGSPIRIRYDQPTNRYEVSVGSGTWSTLIDDPNSAPTPGSPNVNFRIAGTDHSFFMIRAHYSYPADYQYRYSNLAVWAAPDGSGGGPAGTTAFGIPTPAAGMPVSGAASYSGIIEGGSTLQCTCGWDGEQTASWIDGTVSLNFDFAKGTLSGALHPILSTETRVDLGLLPFSNTVFAAGSQSFSGTFATNVSGPNGFSGLFTGPNASELIGKWTFPFTSPYDGSAQVATGAMIAKKP